MKPHLLSLLAAVPLLAACTAEEAGSTMSYPAVMAQPAALPSAQTGSESAWMTALVSAKSSGSLYRAGAFFPHAPAAGGVDFP